MDRSSSTSKYNEKEDEISESKSEPITSETYLAYEDSAGYENAVAFDDTTAYENATANEIATASETVTAYENATAYEITTAYEGAGPYEGVISVSSSSLSLPPVQGSWEIKNISNPTERRSESLDDSEKLCRQNITKLLDSLNSDHEDARGNLDLKDNQEKNKSLGKEDGSLNTDKFCKLMITLILDATMGSNHEDSLATLDLKGEIKKLDNRQKEKLKQTISKLYDVSQKLKELLEDQKDDNDDAEYHQVSSNAPSPSFDVSHPESETYQDLAKWEAPNVEHNNQFLKVQPAFEEEQLIEIISQTSCIEETPSVSARQPEERDSPVYAETTRCCNFQSICQWFRKWFSSLLGRRNPEKATQTHCEQISEKGCSHRNKKIHPQESLS